MKLDVLQNGQFKLAKLVQLMILLCEGRSNTYVQSVLMGQMMHVYQQEKQLPHFKMLEVSMSMTNEEAGEISFSILSRACLGDTQKKKIDHMSDMYRSLHSLRTLDNDLRREFESDHGRKNWRRTFGPEDPTVVEVGSFMKALIRRIKAKQFTKYDGTLDGFKSANDAAEHQVPFLSVTRRWMTKAQMTLALNTQFDKCVKFTNTDWGFQQSAVLPEMAPSLNQANLPMPPEEEYVVTEVIVLASESEASSSPENVQQEHNNARVRLKPKAVPERPSQRTGKTPSKKTNLSRMQPISKTTSEDDSDSRSSRAGGEKSAGSPAHWTTLSWEKQGNVDASLILSDSRARRRKKPEQFRAGNATSSAASDWTDDTEGHRLTRAKKGKQNRPRYATGEDEEEPKKKRRRARRKVFQPVDKAP